MDTVVGVFGERAAAVRAADLLAARGVPRDRVTVLTPGDAERAVRAIPTTESEPSGIGRALGGSSAAPPARRRGSRPGS